MTEVLYQFCKVNLVNKDDTEISNEVDMDHDSIKNYTDNTKIGLSIYPVETCDKDEYITFIGVFDFNISNDCKLVGTNLLLLGGNIAPSFKISYNKDLKYKKEVRELCKKTWNISNKNILNIKHINNNHNYHNYLVILDSKKVCNKFKNCLNIIDSSKYLWKTYFGMLDYNKENISKLSLKYKYLSGNSYEYNIKIQNSSHFINIRSIYDSISAVV